MGTSKHNVGVGGGGGGLTLRWTSITSREEKQYSHLLHAIETTVTHQPDGPLGLQTDFTVA